MELDERLILYRDRLEERVKILKDQLSGFQQEGKEMDKKYGLDAPEIGANSVITYRIEIADIKFNVADRLKSEFYELFPELRPSNTPRQD